VNILLIVISVVTGFLDSLVLQVKNIKSYKRIKLFSRLLHVSPGFAIVTTSEAALFTDGRYFLQASQQLDDNWTLMKQGLPGVPTWQEYLVNVMCEFRLFVVIFS
jgi:hypothetical protein